MFLETEPDLIHRNHRNIKFNSTNQTHSKSAVPYLSANFSSNPQQIHLNYIIDPLQNAPPPLSYSCYVRQAMALSRNTSCSHAVKNTSRRKEETDNAPTDKTEQVTSVMKQIFFFLEIQFSNCSKYTKQSGKKNFLTKILNTQEHMKFKAQSWHEIETVLLNHPRKIHSSYI